MEALTTQLLFTVHKMMEALITQLLFTVHRMMEAPYTSRWKKEKKKEINVGITKYRKEKRERERKKICFVVTSTAWLTTVNSDRHYLLILVCGGKLYKPQQVCLYGQIFWGEQIHHSASKTRLVYMPFLNLQMPRSQVLCVLEMALVVPDFACWPRNQVVRKSTEAWRQRGPCHGWAHVQTCPRKRKRTCAEWVLR